MTTDAAIASATDPIDGIVRGNASRMQAYRLREVAFRFALDVAGVTVENPTEELCARARDFAACVKAWSEADERGRIARGRPLPGSLRPERKPRSPKPRKPVAPLGPARSRVGPGDSVSGPGHAPQTPDAKPETPAPAPGSATS